MQLEKVQYAAQAHTPGTFGLLSRFIEGKPPATYKAGDVLFIPTGAIHWAKNVGSSNGAELATYVVEKGKPLISLVK